MLVRTWIAHRRAEEREPCKGAVYWLRSLGPDATMDQAWAACGRPDWMVWALRHGASGVSESAYRHIAADLVGHLLRREERKGRSVDPRSWAAVRAAHDYADGRIGPDDLRAAYEAAYAAADDAREDAASYTAGAYTYDACAAVGRPAAYAASYTAGAYTAGAYAYDAAYAYAAADIIRARLTPKWGDDA